jgi:4-diphosphocytidyl-2C-methyl-D-erythritol kinase
VPGCHPILHQVKPRVGLATPVIFKALDLNRRSPLDPAMLMSRLRTQGMSQALAVNDLEQPAFDTCVRLTCLQHCQPASQLRMLHLVD